MGLADLPTAAEVNAVRRAVPKYEIPTKLDRAIDKKQAKREDAAKLAAWAKAVKERDHWKDRYTGKPVKKPGKVAILDPDAAHAHHVEPRENEDTRYDVRNGLTLSALTHDKVERNLLRIVGTRFFKVAGKTYINCTYLVKFVEVK